MGTLKSVNGSMLTTGEQTTANSSRPCNLGDIWSFGFKKLHLDVFFFKVERLLIQPLYPPDRHDIVMMELKTRLNHMPSYSKAFSRARLAYSFPDRLWPSDWGNRNT